MKRRSVEEASERWRDQVVHEWNRSKWATYEEKNKNRRSWRRK